MPIGRGSRLDLMTGRPVSFIERLADPVRLRRPTLAREHAAVAPPPTDRGSELVAMTKGGPRVAIGESRRLDIAQQDRVMAMPGGPGGALTGKGVDAAAEGGAMGELYDYRVANPVSIARGHAALVPFLLGAVECERVSIVNADVLADHPLAGALLTNTTGGPIPQGPITILDDGCYGGDASLGDLPSAEHRLISYAVDLPVRTHRAETQNVRRMASARLE